jgi:hypothetical protein
MDFVLNAASAVSAVSWQPVNSARHNGAGSASANDRVRGGRSRVGEHHAGGFAPPLTLARHRAEAMKFDGDGVDGMVNLTVWPNWWCGPT